MSEVNVTALRYSDGIEKFRRTWMLDVQKNLINVSVVSRMIKHDKSSRLRGVGSRVQG